MTATKEAKLRKIVAEHQYAEIEGVLVDAFTANVICKVLDALSENNKAMMLSFPVANMADVAFKLTS